MPPVPRLWGPGNDVLQLRYHFGYQSNFRVTVLWSLISDLCPFTVSQFFRTAFPCFLAAKAVFLAVFNVPLHFIFPAANLRRSTTYKKLSGARQNAAIHYKTAPVALSVFPVAGPVALNLRRTCRIEYSPTSKKTSTLQNPATPRPLTHQPPDPRIEKPT